MSKAAGNENNEGGNPYRARQARSFAYLGTAPNEWIACEIEGFDDDGDAIFDEPDGYETMSPYSEQLTKEEAAQVLAEIANGAYKAPCELCGARINRLCPIRHDGKRYLMYVGTECVNNFMGAGYIEQKIKGIKDDRLRSQFGAWVSVAIQDCWTMRLTGNYPSSDYTDFKKELVRRKYDNSLGKCSTRKIKAAYRKAKKLGISAPDQS